MLFLLKSSDCRKRERVGECILKLVVKTATTGTSASLLPPWGSKCWGWCAIAEPRLQKLRGERNARGILPPPYNFEAPKTRETGQTMSIIQSLDSRSSKKAKTKPSLSLRHSPSFHQEPCFTKAIKLKPSLSNIHFRSNVRLCTHRGDKCRRSTCGKVVNAIKWQMSFFFLVQKSV